eukprot:TRINITY_DN50025_c0_g1_i1.p1 TRINITY_DN50025_c0_g1~~TRINITY_DN50025_c0_g1_i1.p1  ORF type:complete len:331 (+),score=46.95 TRINITY_DN50025_c0_g1_i1:73-993(+)
MLPRARALRGAPRAARRGAPGGAVRAARAAANGATGPPIWAAPPPPHVARQRRTNIFCASRNGAKRVAVYGGAFDPITNAHLTCCSEIIHSGSADEVWFVPCGPRPDKPHITAALDRVMMCEIGVNTAFSMEFPVRVWTGEAFAKEQVFTYDMLCGLRAECPDVDFIFVIGSDWLQEGTDLRQWPSRDPSDPTKTIVTGDKLVEEFDFLVVRRPGYDVSDLSVFGPRFCWLQHVGPLQHVQGNLSSTEIRKRARIDLSVIDGLVPVGVMAYIKRHGLYHEPGVLEASMWQEACRQIGSRRRVATQM